MPFILSVQHDYDATPCCVKCIVYISGMLRTKLTPRSQMEEGEPTMNHEPPYQEAPGIFVPNSVISYSFFQ